MARHAAALQKGPDVSQEFDVNCPRRIGPDNRQAVGVFAQQRHHGRKIDWFVPELAGDSAFNSQWLLAMSMTTAAIVAHFTRTYLVPGLGHGQNQPILVEHLKS